MKKSIVLLAPPFFRLAGSHNDRAPLELCYASRFLAEAEVDHVVVNADYLGSDSHVPWRRLFANDEMWRAAIDGHSPLLDQTIELVMQFKPKQVVIAAGDSCIATKDFGSPYIASLIAQRLRQYNVKTLGIGPMFVKSTEVFQDFFDGFFRSLVNRSIVDVLSGETPDVIGGSPIGVEPCFDHMHPKSMTTDYVLSSFGCTYDCAFCMAHLITSRNVLFQPTGFFVRELLTRQRDIGTNKMYIADMIFPLNIRRLRLIAECLEGYDLDLACESRTDMIRPEILDVLKQIGIKTVKVGLESFDDETLASMSKRQNAVKEERALKLLREYGFKITGYLIFGDFYKTESAMDLTLDRAADLDVDHWVVNVSSYQEFSWDEHRYDSHFSMAAARRQGVPERIMWKALDLQEGKSHPTLEVM